MRPTRVACCLFLLASSSAFSLLDNRRRLVPSPSGRPLAVPRPSTDTRTTLFQESTITTSASNEEPIRSSTQAPKFLFTLNSSTKWLVTLANTLGIWTRLPRCEGPFIVVGAIAATYFTAVLKKTINHDRPAGAPFTDPGMPSSHSLVSFFMAAAWGSLVCSGVAVPLAWAGASTVALLRVVCGYHSWDQISVGALLGSTMGFAWARIGAVLIPSYPQVMQKASWGLYLLGSALFILKDMKEWLHKEKHL